MSEPRISVVVTSFNRPRLLRECLLSVAAARPYEVFIADDGSDCLTAEGRPFSVPRVAAFALLYRCHFAIVQNPPLSVDERMTAKRQGELVNRAFAQATGDIYTLICDDDLMHPGWLDALRAEWTANPNRELVRGTWLQFEDGQTPSEADPLCPMDDRQMTAGNFAWHASLTRERGAEWPVGLLNCLDNGFLWNLHARNVGQFGAPHVGMAGWRREHPKANGWFADGMGNHSQAFRAVLASGSLE